MIGASIVLAGVIIVAVVAAYVAWAVLRNRRAGVAGLVVRSRFTCPSCGGDFERDWVPGASAIAVRLGSSRYMSCPLCHRWSVFPMKTTPSGSAGRPPPG